MKALNLAGIGTLWSDIVAEIQARVSGKAPLESPSLTGTPTAPTASAGTSSTQIATTAFVAGAISAYDAASDYVTSDEIPEVPIATTSTMGKSRPDGTTIFVSEGVLSTTDWSGEVGELQAALEAALGRIEALEQAANGPTYENGNLSFHDGTSMDSGGVLTVSGTIGSDGTLTL